MPRAEESKLYKHIKNGSREMAEHLRALAAALPEDPGSIPSFHMADNNSLFWPLVSVALWDTQINVQAKHSYI